MFYTGNRGLFSCHGRLIKPNKQAALIVFKHLNFFPSRVKSCPNVFKLKWGFSIFEVVMWMLVQQYGCSLSAQILPGREKFNFQLANYWVGGQVLYTLVNPYKNEVSLFPADKFVVCSETLTWTKIQPYNCILIQFLVLRKYFHMCNLLLQSLLTVEPYSVKALSLHTVCRACSPELLELVSRITSDPHQWRTTQVDPPPTHGIAIPAAEVGSTALCVRGL